MVTLASAGALSMEDADHQLIARSRDGDMSAFEELVRRYQNRIFNYVCRMTNDAADAEDLTQDVFVRAYLALDSFRGEASLQTWLYRIAMNLCVDHSRRVQRRAPEAYSLDEPVDGDEGPERELPDNSLDPSAVVETKELEQVLQQGLSQLSEKLRTVLLLYDVEGLSYEEIASTLKCPTGTVKSRLFNARRCVAQHVEAYLTEAAMVAP